MFGRFNSNEHLHVRKRLKKLHSRSQRWIAAKRLASNVRPASAGAGSPISQDHAAFRDPNGWNTPCWSGRQEWAPSTLSGRLNRCAHVAGSFAHGRSRCDHLISVNHFAPHATSGPNYCRAAARFFRRAYLVESNTSNSRSASPQMGSDTQKVC